MVFAELDQLGEFLKSSNSKAPVAEVEMFPEIEMENLAELNDSFSATALPPTYFDISMEINDEE